jgi:hypothetical protein
MRIFFDTEFYENGQTIDLISIGMVREDGKEYYAETPRAIEICNESEWLLKNVKPHLKGRSILKPYIRQQIIEFVGDKPEFWAYYADYDWVVLCQLYGRMIDLPKGWPMFCMDIKQLCASMGNPELPKQEKRVSTTRWKMRDGIRCVMNTCSN